MISLRVAPSPFYMNGPLRRLDLIDMHLKKLLGLLLCVVLLAGCNGTYEWNQKLTVVVQTPDGPVSGSSVTKVTKTERSQIWSGLGAGAVQSSLQGEAVVIEVMPDRFLFVLLDGMDDLAFSAFPQFPYTRGSEFARWARTIERHRGTGIVPPKDYPMMVTFEDISDPTSIRLVEPDDLVAHFGEGVELLKMSLEITEQQVITARLIAMPFWSTLVDQVTFSGLDRFDPASPDPINYITFKSLLQE